MTSVTLPAALAPVRSRLVWCVSVTALLLTGPLASAFTIGVNVAGTNISMLPGLNSGYEFIPPDTMGAIGPSHFVELTNGSYGVYSKSTGALVGSRQSLTGFWQAAGISGLSAPGGGGAGTTDPHIIYDPYSARWFATTIDTASTNNRYLVAVSHSSDPTAGWTGFGITSNTLGEFADFDMLGLNQDVVVVTTNNFLGTSGSHVGVLILPKSDLTAGTPTVANKTLYDAVDPNTTGFSAQPVVSMDNTTGSLSLLSQYNASFLRLSTITGTNTASPSSPSSSFSISAAASSPPNAQQSGGSALIDTGDWRFSGTVILQNGKLWGVQSVDSSSRSALRWVRINDSTGALEESGLIGDSMHDYYYGSIAVNNAGDVVIGYTQSSSTEYASAYVSVGKYNGATTSFEAPFLTAAGSGYYTLDFGTGVRWGDYSQTTINPLNAFDFWTIQEYVTSANVWSTRITQVIIPEPGSIGLLAAAAMCGLLRRRHR